MKNDPKANNKKVPKVKQLEDQDEAIKELIDRQVADMTYQGNQGRTA